MIGPLLPPSCIGLEFHCGNVDSTNLHKQWSACLTNLENCFAFRADTYRADVFRTDGFKTDVFSTDYIVYKKDSSRLHSIDTASVIQKNLDHPIARIQSHTNETTIHEGFNQMEAGTHESVSNENNFLNKPGNDNKVEPSTAWMNCNTLVSKNPFEHLEKAIKLILELHKTMPKLQKPRYEIKALRNGNQTIKKISTESINANDESTPSGKNEVDEVTSPIRLNKNEMERPNHNKSPLKGHLQRIDESMDEDEDACKYCQMVKWHHKHSNNEKPGLNVYIKCTASNSLVKMQ